LISISIVGNRGKEFFILFMRNYRNGPLSIYVASGGEVLVNISSSPALYPTIKSSVDKTSNITHHSKFTLPTSLACEDRRVESKGVIVQTSELSTVIIFDSFFSDSTDGTLVIPTNKLSNKYIVSSTQPYRSSREYYSQFAIGALHHGTSVNITLKLKDNSSISLLGRPYRDDDILTLTLDRLETFQVPHTTDLSGTVITSSKPVAVFSGNRCNRLKNSYCSHMVSQLPPVSELDKQYIVPPFYNNAGTMIQVISEGQSSVKYRVGDRVTTWLLGAAEYKNVEITTNETATVVSDHPVLVTGFAIGGKVMDTAYDPFMAVIPGVHQYLSYYTVVVPDGYEENFLCVIIPSDSAKSLRINGQNVDHYQTVYQTSVLLDKNFKVKIITVQKGSYELRSSDESAFGLLVYGHRRVDGYGFTGNFVFI
jgi:hypothetical protein